LKPENVMVEDRRDQQDFVKVLDFGIAKLLDAEGPGLTSVDVVCGTPQYMAPEQATGTHLDARCDLYAVGVILYQMATGHLPFDGANSMEVLTKQVHDRPIPPRQRQPDAPISEAMETLILRSLEKDAGRRPQTAEQFRDELLAVPGKAREKRASLQAAEPLLRVPTPPTSPKAQNAPQGEGPRKGRRWWWPFPSAGS
ncbi:MAG: serine/threonine protein kinase, partial [Deltaproteobacteria bacterium]